MRAYARAISRDIARIRARANITCLLVLLTGGGSITTEQNSNRTVTEQNSNTARVARVRACDSNSGGGGVGTGRPPAPLTLADLGVAKQLPPTALAEMGLRDSQDGVVINYRREDGGKNCRQRIRTALGAKNGFRWLPGDEPIIPYGLWRLDSSRRNREVWLVEGESDCWTMWYHNLSALGLPGASTAKILEAAHLASVAKLWVWREPDQGGASFVAGVAKRLHELAWKGTALMIEAEEFKDPSAVYLAKGKEFVKHMRYLTLSAKRLPAYAPPPPPKPRTGTAGQLHPDQIERAAAFPLYRLLDKKPGDKVLCIFHNDRTHPSLHLFEDGGGYCFTCQTQVDAIKWLRKNQGLSFVEAVTALQS